MKTVESKIIIKPRSNEVAGLDLGEDKELLEGVVVGIGSDLLKEDENSKSEFPLNETVIVKKEDAVEVTIGNEKFFVTEYSNIVLVK